MSIVENLTRIIDGERPEGSIARKKRPIRFIPSICGLGEREMGSKGLLVCAGIKSIFVADQGEIDVLRGCVQVNFMFIFL